MEDLEKTIDPVLDGAENANPNDTSDGFEINLWDSSPVNEENQDLSEVLSVDATDNTSVTPEESPTNEEITSVEDTEPQTNLPEESLTATPQEDTIESTQEKVVPNLSEALSSVSEPEPVNNEVVLWKFENEMITQKDTSDTPQSFDNSVIEHPAVLDQSPMAEVNAEEQQKAKLAQKAKLELLIKTHESKAQKKWLMTWVLSGVVVTAWVLVLAWVQIYEKVILSKTILILQWMKKILKILIMTLKNLLALKLTNLLMKKMLILKILCWWRKCWFWRCWRYFVWWFWNLRHFWSWWICWWRKCWWKYELWI